MLILYMSFIDDEIHRRLFEEIYMTYRKQMFLVARAVLSNDSDAEDAVHDVFLKIAKSQNAENWQHPGGGGCKKLSVEGS